MPENEKKPAVVAPGKVRNLLPKKKTGIPVSYFLSGFRVMVVGEHPIVSVSFHQGRPLAYEDGTPAFHDFDREAWETATDAHAIEILLDLSDPEQQALLKELKIAKAVNTLLAALDTLGDRLNEGTLPTGVRITV